MYAPLNQTVMGRTRPNATGGPNAGQTTGRTVVETRLGAVQSRGSITASLKKHMLPTTGIVALLLAVLYQLYLLKDHSQQPVGTLHRRSYFYVGQSYVERDNTKESSGQMYVEHLVPAKTTQSHPLLFLAGNGETYHSSAPPFPHSNGPLQE